MTMTHKMTPTLTQPSANGAALMEMLMNAAKRTRDTIRAWQERSLEAQALAQMDDHIRRDLGRPAGPSRPPRFPMIGS